MSNDYKSVTDGVILVGAIAFWNYFLDWLGYRFPRVRRLLRPPPLLLIKDGHVQWRNMRQEMVTEDELMGRLHEHGIERIEEVKKAYLEGDGRISVITAGSKGDSKGAEDGGPERSIT